MSSHDTIIPPTRPPRVPLRAGTRRLRIIHRNPIEPVLPPATPPTRDPVGTPIKRRRNTSKSPKPVITPVLHSSLRGRGGKPLRDLKRYFRKWRDTATPYTRKRFHEVRRHLSHFIDYHGIDKVGVFTLAFHPTVSSKEAMAIFNSLATNVLVPDYRDIVRVVEYGSQRGHIHIHGLVALSDDIRTGNDLATIDRGDYSNITPTLKKQRDFWATISARYGFRSVQFEPIRTTAERVSCYLAKDAGRPTPTGERIRRVAHLGREKQARIADQKSVVDEKREKARAHVKAYVQRMADDGHISAPTYAAMRAQYTSNWFWKLRADIARFKEGDPYFHPPTEYHDLRQQFARARHQKAILSC